MNPNFNIDILPAALQQQLLLQTCRYLDSDLNTILPQQSNNADINKIREKLTQAQVDFSLSSKAVAIYLIKEGVDVNFSDIPPDTNGGIGSILHRLFGWLKGKRDIQRNGEKQSNANIHALETTFTSHEKEVIQMIELLIPANINANKNFNGWAGYASALCFAVATESNEIIKLLLKAGADPFAYTGDLELGPGYYARMLNWPKDKPPRCHAHVLELAQVFLKENQSEGNTHSARRLEVIVSTLQNWQGKELTTSEFNRRLEHFNLRFAKKKKPNEFVHKLHDELSLTVEDSFFEKAALMQREKATWKEIADQSPEEIRPIILDVLQNSQSNQPLKLSFEMVEGVLKKPDAAKFELKIISDFTARAHKKISQQVGSVAQQQAILSCVPRENNNNNDAIRTVETVFGSLEETLTSLKKIPSLTELQETIQQTNFLINESFEKALPTLASSFFTDIQKKILNEQSQNALRILQQNSNLPVDIAKEQILIAKKKLFEKANEIMQPNNNNQTFKNIQTGIQICSSLFNAVGQPKIAQGIQTAGEVASNIFHSINTFTSIMGSAALLGPAAPYVAIGGAVLSVMGGLFGKSGPSPEEAMRQQLSQLNQKIDALSQHMDEQFASLNRNMQACFIQLADYLDKRLDQVQDMIVELSHRQDVGFKNLANMMIQFSEHVDRRFDSIVLQMEDLQIDLRILMHTANRIERRVDWLINLTQENAILECNRKVNGARRRGFSEIETDPVKLKENKLNAFDTLSTWVETKNSENIGDTIRDPRLTGSSLLSQTELCVRVRDFGIAYSINSLTTFANLLSPVANPIEWAKIANNIIKLTIQLPNMPSDKRNNCIKAMKETGKKINDFVIALQKSQELFTRLCQNYLTAVNNLLNQLQNLQAGDNIFTNNNVTDRLDVVDNTYQLLAVFSMLAFHHDRELKIHLQTKVWDKNDFAYYIKLMVTPNDKKFFLEAIKRNALNAFEMYEDILLKLIWNTNNNPKSLKGYPLVEATLDKIEQFEQSFNQPRITIGKFNLYISPPTPLSNNNNNLHTMEMNH